MKIQAIKNGTAWKFTVNVAGKKKEYYTATREEGQDIAALLLGGTK